MAVDGRSLVITGDGDDHRVAAAWDMKDATVVMVVAVQNIHAAADGILICRVVQRTNRLEKEEGVILNKQMIEGKTKDENKLTLDTSQS